MIDVVRDLLDVGLRVGISVPASWSEVAVEGAFLVVGGPLEATAQTLVPTVQLRLREAADVIDAELEVTAALESLEEVAILYRWTGVDARGCEQSIAEIAHQSDVTGAVQISMLRSIFLPTKHLALSAVGCCGGGASQEARDILREVVTSISVADGP